MTQIDALYTKLMVNGVDLSAYLDDYDIEDTLKNKTGNMIRIYLNQLVSQVASFQTGQSIVLTEGTVTNTDYAVFRGKIWKATLEDREIVIVCKDRLNEYGGYYFTETYDINIDPQAGVISEIFADIVEEGGYTASTVDSGTTTVLKRFRSRDKTRLERMATLAKILDWSMREDYDNEWIRLEPKGYTSFATPLVIGQNVFNIPFWEENIEPMRNKIKVKGAVEEGTVTTSFTGDGSTTTKELEFVPSGTTKLYNVTTSTDLLRGIADSSDEGDYQVDDDLRTITFTIAPTTGHEISIEYVALLPKDVEGENAASMASTGITRGDVYEFKDIQNVDDAETRLQKLLELMGEQFVSTTLQVNRTLNIRPGQTVSVIDPQRPSKSGNYVVISVRRNYTEPYITVKIGDTDFDIKDFYESLETRLQALEDAELVDTTLLRQMLITQGKFVHMRVRYEDLYHRDATDTPDTLYWDNTIQGDWDDFDWADPDAGDLETDGFALINRLQGGNTYTELVRDNDFYDSVNSTGTTWDTPTKTITINAGTMYTKVISLGTLFSAVTVNIAASTGTYTVQVSADNKSSWQTITLGARTALTSSTSTGFYLRITSAGTSTITNVTINPINGIYETPAIEAVLEE